MNKIKKSNWSTPLTFSVKCGSDTSLILRASMGQRTIEAAIPANPPATTKLKNLLVNTPPSEARKGLRICNKSRGSVREVSGGAAHSLWVEAVAALLPPLPCSPRRFQT